MKRIDEHQLNRTVIAFIADDGFIMPTGVAIQSAIENKKSDSYYKIYVITNGVSERNRERLSQLSSETVDIDVLEVSAKKYERFADTVSKTKSNVSITALLKFDLPELLPLEDKVLYMDGDILVKGDLTELFSIDIHEYYVAAVKDSSSLYTDRSSLGKKYENYFNSGIMLLNLDNMRKNSVTEKLIETKSNLKDVSLMDQNVFNIVMDGAIYPISILYNFMYINLKRSAEKYSIEQLNEMYGCNYNNLDEYLNDAVIVHYASKDKPWKTVDTALFEPWYEVYLRSGLTIDHRLLVAPQVSIIITVERDEYETNLYKTLECLELQASDAFEVIVVTNLDIDEERIKKKIGTLVTRVKYIDQSCGVYKLLYYGIQVAESDSIVWIQAGNTLAGGAIQTLIQKIQENRNCDVIFYKTAVQRCFGEEELVQVIEKGTHFPSSVFSVGAIADDKNKQSNDTKEQLKARFWDHLLRIGIPYITLWNGIYKRRVLLKSLSAMTERDFNHGEVELLAPVLTWMMSSSFEAIDERILLYCTNRREGNFGNLAFQDFESMIQVLDRVSVFDVLLSYEAKVKSIELIQKKIVATWLYEVKQEDSAKAFDLIMDRIGGQLLTILSTYYSKSQKLIASRIQGAESLKTHLYQMPLTIGLYFHTLVNGGIQRVISLMSEAFTKHGYRVVVFTDEALSEDEYTLPEANCVRCVLPDSRVYKNERYAVRETEFRRLLAEHHVDVFIDHAWASGSLLWDTILIKSCGIPVIAHVHNIDALWFRDMRDPGEKTEVYKNIDAAIVLSRVEKEFFGQFTRAYYIPNPPTFDIANTVPSALNNQNILWIARMDERKNPLHMIHAFAKVKKVIPDATLTFVGSGEENVIIKLKKQIEYYGLEKSVSFEGFNLDVGQFYQNASIFCMTSYHEGYPMTLIESKVFGVPAVVYNMPYLEMLRENRGMSIVELGNYDQMATKIIELLSDRNKLQAMAKEARSSVENITEDYICECYYKVFQDLKQESPIENNDSMRILLENIITYHKAGVDRYVDIQKKQVEKLKREKEKLLIEHKERYVLLQDLRKEKVERYQQLQALLKEKGERWKQIQELQKEKGERWQQLQALRHEKSEFSQELTALKKEKQKETEELTRRNRELQEEVKRIHNSGSYRLALGISRIVRPFAVIRQRLKK